MRICVVGLGYIGLPTASILAMQGFEVVGVDIRPDVVDVVNRGQVHIREPGLMTVVQAATMSGRLRAQSTPTAADVFVIAVPTPHVETAEGVFAADLAAVEAATGAVAEVLKAGNLVILESTSPPGTTQHTVAAGLQAQTGLTPGEDFHIAYCPERVLPGRILRELIGNDRVIGGVTPACAQRAAEVYRTFVEGECLLTDALTAEMVKLMENTYRDVNIALANELAAIGERLGFDANIVIELANRHPRVQLHRPGPGVGGHCISVDPWFVIQAAPDVARLMRLARDINRAQPAHVADRVADWLEGLPARRVAVFGVAYKGNVDDVRESPVTEIIAQLQHAGTEVRVYDPHVREYEHELVGLVQALEGADLLLLGSSHDEFRYLDPAAIGEKMAQRRVFDTVAVIDRARWEAAGFEVMRVGASL